MYELLMCSLRKIIFFRDDSHINGLKAIKIIVLLTSYSSSVYFPGFRISHYFLCLAFLNIRWFSQTDCCNQSKILLSILEWYKTPYMCFPSALQWNWSFHCSWQTSEWLFPADSLDRSSYKIMNSHSNPFTVNILLLDSCILKKLS